VIQKHNHSITSLQTLGEDTSINSNSFILLFLQALELWPIVDVKINYSAKLLNIQHNQCSNNIHNQTNTQNLEIIVQINPINLKIMTQAI
jgi:hypothetical protein